MKHRLIVSVFLFGFLTISAGVSGQVGRDYLDAIQTRDSDETVTLPESPALADYERMLLYQNSEIRGAYAAWQAELSRIALRRGLPDPRVSFGYFIQNIETAVGPQEYKLGVQQLIPWPGKLKSAGELQSKRAEAAEARLRTAIFGRLRDLRLWYYDAYLLERSIEITTGHLALVRGWERVILNRYTTDRAGHAGLIKAQIETLKLEDDLVTLESQRKPLLERLRALLNDPTITQIQTADSLDVPIMDASLQGWKAAVLEDNPDLDALDAQRAVSFIAVRRARMEYLPDLGVGFDYILTGDRMGADGPAPESGKDSWVIMGSVNIPIWFGKQAAGVRAARHAQRQAEARLESETNRLSVRVEDLLFEWEAARRQASLYSDRLIPMSRESVRASEAAYTGGEVDFLDVIDAQRRALSFELEAERAKVRTLKAKAGLDAMAGRTL